jgi:hypothetical protein
MNDDTLLIEGKSDGQEAQTSVGDTRRAFLGEETVPLQGDRGGLAEEDAEALGEDAEAPTAADLEVPRSAGEDRPFVSEETVPLRDDRERREAEERDARLRLLLPARRFRRW